MNAASKQFKTDFLALNCTVNHCSFEICIFLLNSEAHQVCHSKPTLHIILPTVGPHQCVGCLLMFLHVPQTSETITIHLHFSNFNKETKTWNILSGINVNIFHIVHFVFLWTDVNGVKSLWILNGLEGSRI